MAAPSFTSRRPLVLLFFRKCSWPATAIPPRHGTNLPPGNRWDTLALATVDTRGLRLHHVRTRQCRVRPWPPEYADERLGSVRALAVKARVPSGDPLYSFPP